VTCQMRAFAIYDSDNDGYITQRDIAEFLEKAQSASPELRKEFTLIANEILNSQVHIKN